MKHLIVYPAAVSLVLGLAACGGGDADSEAGSTKAVAKVSVSDFVGVWHFDKEAMREPAVNSMLAELPAGATDAQKEQMRTMADSMLSSMVMDLTINEDKTYSVLMRVPGRSDEISKGSWTLADGVISMVEDGEDASKVAMGHLDNGRLLVDPPAGESELGQIVMIR